MKEIEELIKKVVDGELEKVNLPTMIPIRDVESYLKTLGFKPLEMDGDETNGWQVDFWYRFVHPKKGRFMLSGSLHYGGFNFSKDDIQEGEEDD